MINEKLIFLNMATYYQQKMGYKASWIYVIFKEKFGVWPNELLKQKTPAKPDNEFIQWIEEYQAAAHSKINEKNKLQVLNEEKTKLESLAKKTQIPRKGKTARELAEKFGISIRSVQTYTSIPRTEYEANSIAKAAPWETLGMSRATWYRKGKPDVKQLQKEEAL